MANRLCELEQMARTQITINSQRGPLKVCSLEELSHSEPDPTTWMYGGVQILIDPPVVSGYLQYIIKLYGGELDA